MSANDALLPRDKLLRDTFTPAETTLFTTILTTSAVVFWLAAPRSNWLLGFFLIVGCLTPMILKLHEHMHPFFVDRLWIKFWWVTAPGWLVFSQYVIGLFRNPLYSISVEGERFLALRDSSRWLPISTGPGDAWLTVAGYLALLLIAVNLFFVPKSRAFFERMLPWLCTLAVLVGVFGLVQNALGLDAPLLTPGTGRSDFYAFFPYDGHWAAFAILWTSACFAMALLTTRYEDSLPFVESSGPFYLAGGLVLGFSGLLVEAPEAGALLIFVTSVLLLLFAVHFTRSRKDPHRTALVVLTSFLAVAAFATGLIRLIRANSEFTDRAELWQCAWRLFTERPVFGWGMDSFGYLLPFFGSDLLHGRHYERAGSDALQFLAEFGIFGVLVFLIMLAALVIRYFSGRHDIQLTNHIFVGCAALLVLAVVDTPFMSPTVTFSFFMLFFTALRWADLSRKRVDEVDAGRPVLVTPESKRNVPFYPNRQEEKVK